ncbi:MAG: type II toxin-antitoxin system RelE/ParE family toxin [Clostridia bacterium]|nr:type II toxin-antitoxin system RelE/ParE family toxin [Clostridia bacterium]
MKKYKLAMTVEAKADLKNILSFLQKTFHNQQAVRNIWEDFRETKKTLARSAGSLPEPESERLRERGLKRINFLRHSYFILYIIENETAVIVNIFHMLEDYENKLK